MPDAFNPSLLQRLMRSRRARRQPDPAEMGTAFGLEYTLDPLGPPPADADTAAREPSAPWWQRWGGPKPSR